jgi:glycosyltransferase involved in cell wall biosynthesis
MSFHQPISSMPGEHGAAVFKQKSWPRISIGMPIFNCEKTLAIAIRSILNQTFSNWELLLIEDGSSDRSLEVARSFVDPRISVFSDRLHKGIVPRLNQAVAASRGEYFARMDGDDIAYPERLDHQIRYLEQHHEVDLLGCGMLVFKNDRCVVGIRPAPETHDKICRHPWAGFHVGHPTWMGRTEWFRTHQYDAKAICAEDQVLLLRSYSSSRFACLPEILCGYREDHLVLRKILRARYSFSIAAFKEFFGRGDYFIAMGGVLQQCVKALVDTFAVATNLNYRVLRHRAGSFDQFALEHWENVCSQVLNEGGPKQPDNEYPTPSISV